MSIERPKPFAQLWDAPGTPRPPTTVANPLGHAGRAEMPSLRPSSIGERYRRLQPEEMGAIPSIDRWGGIDLSPDGTEVAFAWDRSGELEIHTAPLAGDRIIQLTGARARSVAPRWSADGRWVAFLRDQGDGRMSLWLVDRDGERERKLTTVAGAYRDPAWSPDGTRIALADAGARAALYVIDVATGESPRIADGAQPRWSPDGSWLLFARGDDLFITAARGGEARMLETREAKSGRSTDGRWSPDGSMVAFTTTVRGRSEMAFAYVRDGSVTRLERLGARPFDDTDPVWRPDGRGVVYRHHEDGDVSLRRVFTISHADDAVMDLPGSHGSPQVGPDSETVVAVHGDPRRGADVVVRPKGAVAIARITRSLPGEIDPAVLVEPTYVPTDGTALGALVYVPHVESARGARRAPVVLSAARAERDWDPATQLLANHGHIVAISSGGPEWLTRILSGAGLADGTARVLDRPDVEGAQSVRARVDLLRELLATAERAG